MGYKPRKQRATGQWDTLLTTYKVEAITLVRESFQDMKKPHHYGRAHVMQLTVVLLRNPRSLIPQDLLRLYPHSLYGTQRVVPDCKCRLA